ncbi:hypothetical protein AAJ76_460002594 [Vairimorpha ceranae]|uniref:Uncharacterized protein n=1 Tax=Vairimorpha ceranae TaxID=40302 RepID=A0A0F9WP45_9MICR|nr:hypothetical protein AAJ76_460002594 [Vairimorpha ceranae]KKO74763.1 hypothetical protein AAJ76_460002594 [Vairimorpha ceranae]
MLRFKLFIYIEDLIFLKSYIYLKTKRTRNFFFCALNIFTLRFLNLKQFSHNTVASF